MNDRNVFEIPTIFYLANKEIQSRKIKTDKHHFKFSLSGFPHPQDRYSSIVRILFCSFLLCTKFKHFQNLKITEKTIEAKITQFPLFIAQICGNPPVDRIIVEIPNGELLKPGQQSSDKIFRLQSWERPFLSNVAASSSR